MIPPIRRFLLRLHVERGWCSFVNRTQALALLRRLDHRWVRSPILDAGAGPGNSAMLLAARGVRVVGLDVDAARLSRLADRLRQAPVPCDVGVVVANGERLPFPDATFGLVFCNSVLEHVDDDRRMIAECSRVLVAAGVLAITVPDESLRFGDRYCGFWRWVWSWPDWLKDLVLDPRLARTMNLRQAQEQVEKKYRHLRRYNPESLRELLAEQHLTVVEYGHYLTRLGAFWHDVIIAFGLRSSHLVAYVGHLLNCADRVLPRVAPSGGRGKGFTMVAIRRSVYS